MIEIKDFEPDIAAVFEEWQRRWQENPTGFMSDPETHGEPPKSYGELASRTFLKLWNELAEIVP